MNSLQGNHRAPAHLHLVAALGLAALGAGCGADVDSTGDRVGRAAQAVHDDGIFELDGNAVNDAATPGDDWSNVLLSGGGSSLAHTGVVVDPVGGSIFTGGGSKDPLDVSQWKYKDGSVPDKDDITNAYAAAYTHLGDLIIYFGADRFAQDGDAQIGFWFFKNEITLNPNGTFNGVHAIGDILVLSDFSQGGTVSTVRIFKWVGSGGSDGALDLVDGGVVSGGPGATAFCLPDDLACASINKAPTASPWPYTPKAGAAGTLPTGAFFEGGINVSDLVPGNNCFSSFLAETRSSTSPTATLKDFALGELGTCKISVAKTCDVVTLNPPGSAKLFTATFSATVTNSSGSALPVGTVITVVDDAGTPDDPSDDVTQQSPPLAAALPPGGTVPFSGQFQTDANPPTNTIRATALVGTDEITSDPSSTVCNPLPLPASISVLKNCDQVTLESVPTTLPQGSVLAVRVHVSGQVCNTSPTVPLTVSAVDDEAGPLVLSDSTLDPGQCATYGGSYLPTSADGGATNPALATFSDTVTASGTNTTLGITVTGVTDDATCNLCPATN